MTNLTPDTPIVVPSSPLQTQFDTFLGQLLQAAGGLVVGYGLLTPQKWALWAALVPIIGSAAWRIWSATRHHDQQVIMAHAAPDSVAVVASK